MSTIGKAFPVRLVRYLVLAVHPLGGRGGRARSAIGRGSQRYRFAALGGAATVLSSAVKMLSSLIAIPLVLHHIGVERFGVWVTLTSLSAVVVLGDLGIGNGLINAISTANGNDDRTSARIYVSSALFMVLAFSSVLLVVLLLLDAVVPWPTLFKLSSPTAVAEVGPAVTVLIICIVVQVPLGVVVNIRTGYQEVYVNMLWYTVGSGLGLGVLLALLWLGASLPWLILADQGVPIIAIMGNLASLFLVKRPWLRPASSCVSLDAMRRLFNLGLLFFVLQLGGIVAFSLDNLVAIWAAGPEAAGLYAIAVKLFSPCRVIAGTVVGPLWPAYGEAIARGDIAWVRRTIAMSIVVAEMLVVPLALIGFLFGNSLASLWLQRPISFGYTLLAGMALWVILEAIGSGMAIFLNGASAVRPQVPLCVAFAAVAFAAKVIMANKFGVGGIIWGTIFAYFSTQLAPYSRLVRLHIRELTARKAVVASSQPYSAGAPPSA